MSSHIFIIEDNPDVRSAFTKLLRLDGHRVTVASNGREGLAKLKDCESAGLIFLDLMMPGFDGWAFRERQDEKDVKMDVPLVLISGVSGDLRGEAEAIGADAAVAKPIGPDRLRSLVDTYCREENTG